MQITVSGKQLDVGSALREHIEDALTSLADKYFGAAIEASVVLSREAHLVRADVAMHIGRGIHLHCTAVQLKSKHATETCPQRRAKSSTRLARLCS